MSLYAKPHIIAMVLLSLLFHPALADENTLVDDRADALSRFLQLHDLTELHAVHLRHRVEQTKGKKQTELAEQLARIYIQMLSDSQSDQARMRWETLSMSLLKLVPNASTHGLQIDLAKVRYLHAESIAEKSILRLVPESETLQAIADLQQVASDLQRLGTTLNRRVQLLERHEERPSSDPDVIRSALREARRLRSVSRYYQGWSLLYIAMLNNTPADAQEALRAFGWLLNAPPGRPASIENVSPGMLRFEHVARSAVGAALCESMRDNASEAMRWLDTVSQTETVPQVVRDQIPARRIFVLTRARRWADLDLLIQRLRRDNPPKPLDITQARLLAILTLDQSEQTRDDTVRRVLRALAQTAIADLTTGGQIHQVLNILDLYGDAPIGTKGFIVHFVKGMRDFERARIQLKELSTLIAPAGSDTEKLFIRASKSFSKALADPQPDRFPAEHGKASYMLGSSLISTRSFDQGVQTLQKLASTTQDQTLARDALWLAIRGMDEAIKLGQESMAQTRNELSLIFLQSYPRTEQAAALLLKQAADPTFDPRQAVETLLSVSPDSPLYEAARRHAASFLYRLYRKASSSDRDFLASRFVDIAEPLLQIDASLVRTQTGEPAARAARSAVLLVRQMADVLLGVNIPTVPAADRARAALDLLKSIANQANIDLDEIQGELLFRRLQIAIVYNDDQQAEDLLLEVRALGGRFAEQCDRLVYKTAINDWSRDTSNPKLARQVALSASAVLRYMDQNDQDSPLVLSLFNTIAASAAVVFHAEQDNDMRDIALRADRRLFDQQRMSASALRRFATLSENARDFDSSLQAWLRLMGGVTVNTSDWYEARYESIRLMLLLDPARARRAMAQHKILYPNLGPAPWADLMAELDARISITPDKPTQSTQEEGG